MICHNRCIPFVYIYRFDINHCKYTLKNESQNKQVGCVQTTRYYVITLHSVDTYIVGGRKVTWKKKSCPTFQFVC